jgi:hypothetical protein
LWLKALNDVLTTTTLAVSTFTQYNTLGRPADPGVMVMAVSVESSAYGAMIEGPTGKNGTLILV